MGSMTTGKDINVIAIEQMNQLNKLLKEAGYVGQDREKILVRLLLCFFADDTDVFPRGSFFAYLEKCMDECTIGMSSLNRLFTVLAGTDAPSEDLKVFPMIQYDIFHEEVPCLDMDAFFWLLLLNSREIEWRNLSPAIFGAMFQEIMNQQDRKEWGAYYTSEDNIMKLIRPLFLDQLQGEREACRGNRKRLLAFHKKLAELRFLDPACGCGNFLILIYRELRLLELSVIQELYNTDQRVLDISMYCKVSVQQFYGLEIEGFQAQIARIGMWLTERQMNLLAADQFGFDGCIMPWVRQLKIRQCNALNTEWRDIISPERLNFIVGNPPFLGARLMNSSQKQDMKIVFRGTKGLGNLDYVTAWYKKAAEYMMGSHVRAAFVSTNSICQGEQAGILWKLLSDGYNMSIDFAWKSFVWNNEARNQAKVHCIIVGFSDRSAFRQGEQMAVRALYSNDIPKLVPNINAYLTAGPDIFVTARRTPISDVPEMIFGNMANDDGYLVLTPEERRDLVDQFPETRTWIHPFLGAAEFINGKERYCLWLADVPEEKFMKIPPIANRVMGVASFRRKSTREATKEMAETPHRFGEIRQPDKGSYILIPRVSSVRRPYIPMGFVNAQWIASDAVLIIPDADESIFAILTSSLHMIWVKAIAGRLKSDFRYSASVVYNNFPFPVLTEEQRGELQNLGIQILNIRNRYQESSLADLYDPNEMPADLLKAHEDLDEYVLSLYGVTGKKEDEILEELLMCYARMTQKGV